MTHALFTPIKVGHMSLSHRIALAPLTHFRAYLTHVPGPHAATYYAQRASLSGTLLISEATLISQAAGGLDFVPGIYTQEHVAGWKEITDAVHEKKSKENNSPLVSASAIPLSTSPTHVPHAITESEIKTFITAYAAAARNSIEAGFDGVEIHGANGYFVDQFLQEVSNTRDDDWGGSVEKRARFGIEVVDAVVEAIGAQRVSIRLSPWSPHLDMGSTDPIPQFSYLVRQLKKHNLAYLHVIEPRIGGSIDVDAPLGSTNDPLRQIWCGDGNDGVFISTGGHTRQTAIETVEAKGGMVAFGRLYISNPDLPLRLMRNLPLTKYDRSTFYLRGDLTGKGYTDYPMADDVYTTSVLRSEVDRVLPQ